MLTEKDLAIVIPTYNRPEDVDRTLSVMIRNKNIPGKIFVVDQSKDERTKKVTEKYKKKLPLKYIYSKTPSSSIAENMGVKEGMKTCKLLLILGDDVDLLKDYVKNLVKTFNNNPNVMGVGGADRPEDYDMKSCKNIISNFYLRFFLLPHMRDHKFLVTSPYGNTASPTVEREIRDAQWLPGFNNCFRKKIYENYKFPEIKGYNVLEDIDCSYRTYKEFGEGSLMITPECKTIHRWSQSARYPEKKRIYANHEDHFAFYYRNFKGLSGRIKFLWALFGILLGNFLRLLRFNKRGFHNFTYNFSAIYYCFKNRKKIKKGIFRNFLNEDLSFKKG